MVQLSYPGVYIEELSSGVHTITGVATSIAAFVGWAPQGPTTSAVLVQSWPDFQRQFGSFTNNNGAPNYLAYAVNQFFGNGGQQAYIIRLVWDGTQQAAPGTTPAVAATALAAGLGFPTAQITATVTTASGPISASATVNVGAPVLQSLVISPANLQTVPLGVEFSLYATGTFADGSMKTLSSPVLWQSSDPTTVSISSDGTKVIAKQPGAVVLTATSGLISSSLTLNVGTAAASSIQVFPSSFALAMGQTQQMMVVATLADTTTQDVTSIVNWTTSPSSPAEVTITNTSATTAAGMATPVPGASGTASITASLNIASGTPITGVTSSISVGPAVATSIALYPANPVLNMGQSVKFAPIATLTDATSGPLSGGTETWTSSNESVAKVDTSGNATLVGTGITTIMLAYTLNSISLSASATLTVTAATLTSISVTPINASTPVWVAPSANSPNRPVLQLQMTATGFYSDGSSVDLTKSVTWTSQPDATINANTGVVRGNKIDPSVTVTAAPAWNPEAIKGSVAIAVTAPVPQLISITSSSNASSPFTMASSQTLPLVATPTYSDGSQTPAVAPVWNSSAPTIVSVNLTNGSATALAAGGSLTLFANSPGAWGNSLQISVTQSPLDPTKFGLLVQQANSSGQLATLESFVNLSAVPTDPNYAVTVIDNDSNYITFVNPAPSANGAVVAPTAAPSPTPAGVTFALSGGADGAVLVPASDQNFEAALLANTPTACICSIGSTSSTCSAFRRRRTRRPSRTCKPIAIEARVFHCRPLATRDPIGIDQFGSGRDHGRRHAGNITAGVAASNSAFYFPWISAPDPLVGNRPTLFPPCGFVAGIYAATDASARRMEGPAGIDASLSGSSGLQYNLTDLENGDLNTQAINCLRSSRCMATWCGARARWRATTRRVPQWKYVPIRRLALFLESSLYDGTQWVVFEPNDETLWGQIRLNVGVFHAGSVPARGRSRAARRSRPTSSSAMRRTIRSPASIWES